LLGRLGRHLEPLHATKGAEPIKTVRRRADYVRVKTRRQLADSEALHRLVIRNLPGAGIGLYGRDLRCLLLVGPAVERAGIDGAAMVGRHLRDVTPEYAGAVEPVMLAALEGREGSVELDTGGRTTSLEIAPYRDDSGAIAGVLCVARDVTAERRAERAQREAEERFRAAFDRAPIGMAIVGLDGRFAEVNDALAQILGRPRSDIERTPPGELLDPADRARAAAEIIPILRGECDAYAGEFRLLHGQGNVVWANVHVAVVRDGDGRPRHLLGQLQDITERKRYEERLRHLADHDPLTGLLNRRSFERALERHVTSIRRYGAAGALLVIDLDGFKHVNDTLGHAAGDELLVSCAQALRGRLRGSDVLSRLGGDEFAVLLPRGGEEDAVATADALVSEIRNHTRVTASIGVATFGDVVATADDVLVHADRAMYEAKAAGRDRHAVHGTGRRTAA
jgi:diguanylate cyclase (GGDEF)-like protein/PAS domain S-box-containing protein